MVATWKATAPGERVLWSEFLRMISGRSDMVVGGKEGDYGTRSKSTRGEAPGRRWNVK